jgi:uncharacterized protein (UPF0248 family)
VGENRLRHVLNRLRWDPGMTPTEVVLEVRAREGGEEELEPVGFEAIGAILADGVVLADETFLPYHRIVAVRRGRVVLWQVRERDRGGRGP